MKRSLLLLAFFIGSLSANGQFSIATKYSLNSYTDWTQQLESINFPTDQFLDNGLEYELAYWFRLKNKRIEFLPGVSFQKNSFDSKQTIDWDKTSIYLNLTAVIYPLDMEGDCNCPTFGKDGDLFSKGFFIGISPSIGSHKLQSTYTVLTNPDLPEDKTFDSNQISFRIGGIAGIDIGINKWITLTPQINVYYNPGLEWEGFETILNYQAPDQNQSVNSSITEIQPGLKLTFRPDYLLEQRRMFR